MKPHDVPKQPLSPRQKAVFEWIADQILRLQTSPGVRNIADEFDISVGNASRYVSELVEKGWLTKNPKKRYSIQVVQDVAAGRP